MLDIPDLIASNRYHPLSDQLVARIDKVQSYGHIILAPEAQYETNTATVLAVGPDLPSYLTIGVRVLPHQHSGLCIFENNDVRYVSYRLKDIQAVFMNPSHEELTAFFAENS